MNTQILQSAEATSQWYAVYIRPRQEVQVAKHLEVRRVEAYLAWYHAVHRWKNRCTRQLDLPLFPGYIFARIMPTERVRVLEVPGVVYLVGAAGKPTPLPDSEIEALRAGLQMRNPEPHPFLREGERVRIRSGALEGMEGILKRSKNSLRVVINLDLIMRGAAVEVGRDEVEPVANAGPHFC